MYETSVHPTHLWPYSESAEKHLIEPLVTTLNGRLRAVQQASNRPSRSRSTFVSRTPTDRLREMVYRNKRSRASSTGAHAQNAEPSFPDRLANALKSLKPSLLSHSSSSSSAFRNKSDVLADDVLYFPNVAERQWSRNQEPAHLKQSHSMDRNEIEPFSRSNESHHFRQHRPTQRKASNNGPPTPILKTLDDVRQLYKSVPNFNALEDESDLERNNLYDTHRPSGSIGRSGGEPSNSNSHNRLNSKTQLDANNVSPSLSPRSLNAMSASISSSNSSTRSAADSGYRSHKRPTAQQTENLNECLLKAKNECSKNSSPSADNMRSLVYVDPGTDDEINQFGNRKISTHQPTVLHVSKTIVASGSNSSNTQSTWVNMPINCPDRYSSVFSYTTKDLKMVLNSAHLNTTFNNQSYSMLLEIFRSTLDQFCVEVQRFVGPFVKCTRRDVNMALMIFLNEKTAYTCIDYATQSLNAFSTNPTVSLSMENRASLKLNVGKMFRFLRHNRSIKIAFDTVSVYLSGVFEKLLLLFTQTIEKTKGQRPWNECFQQYKSLFDVFSKFDTSTGICIKSRRALDDLLAPLADQPANTWRHKWHQNYGLGLRFNESAKRSLYYYVECLGDECVCTQKKPSFSDWMTKLMFVAEHRNTLVLDTYDILEVARCLLSENFPSSPIEQYVDTLEAGDWKTLDTVYLWDNRNESKRPDLRSQLAHCDPNRTNGHGLSCISRCIICQNENAVETMINQNCNIDLPISPSNIKGLQRNSKMLDDFLGWSPIFWSAATNNVDLTQKLIQKRIKLNAGWMTSETPLQIAAAIDNEQIVRLLLSEAVDLFFTSIRYDEGRDDRNGVPSALAISSVLGKNHVFDMLLDEYRALGSSLKYQIPASIADLLKNESMAVVSPKIDCCTQTVNFAVFPKPAQGSLREALYYAVECGNLDIAYELSCFGVKWNVNLWAKCLTWAMEQKSGLGIKLFVDTFQVNQLIDAPLFLLEELCNTLFEAVELGLTQSFINEDIRNGLLSTISFIFKHFNTADNENRPKTDRTLQNSKPSNGVLIDPKYCNNEKYSDIQFVVEERKIFAHRIVISAHPKFEAALQNSSSLVRIEDVTYDVFKAIIEFVYGKQAECMKRVADLPIQHQLRAIDSAEKFGLDELAKRIMDLINEQINCTSCVPVFVYACNSHNDSLLKMVEPFIMRNLESLATSVEQRDRLIELNGKYRLLKRLADQLNRYFRSAYEKPQTLQQQFSVQKF